MICGNCVIQDKNESANLKFQLVGHERSYPSMKTTPFKQYFLQCPTVGCKITTYFLGLKFQKAIHVRLQENAEYNPINDAIKKENADIREGHETIKNLNEEMEVVKKKYEKQMAAIKAKIEKAEKSNLKRARKVENLQSIENDTN